MPRISLIGCLLFSTVLASGFAQEVRLQTVAPTPLLKALPSVPADWKLLQSKAENTFSVSGSPITVATRRYELPPPPPESPSAPPPPAPLLRFIAMDLGSRSPESELREALADVDSKKKDTLQVGGLSGKLRAYPGRLLFDALSGNRLLVQLEARHLEAADFKKLLASLDWKPLIALEKTFPDTPLPVEQQIVIENFREVPVWVYEGTNERIDELRPSVNRTWKSSIMDR